MTHVLNTLEKCKKLLETLSGAGFRQSECFDDNGLTLLQSINSALFIVKHESVQCPLTKEEAGLMIQVAKMFLGEITL